MKTLYWKLTISKTDPIYKYNVSSISLFYCQTFNEKKTLFCERKKKHFFPCISGIGIYLFAMKTISLVSAFAISQNLVLGIWSDLTLTISFLILYSTLTKKLWLKNSIILNFILIHQYYWWIKTINILNPSIV